MATTDPTQVIKLTEEQVNERRDILGARIMQRDKIELQKSSQTKKWNEQLRLLDDQISTLGREVKERAAIVPAPVLPGTEGAMTAPDLRGLDGDDGDDESDDDDGVLHASDMKPGKKRPAKKAAKKARASRSKNGASATA